MFCADANASAWTSLSTSSNWNSRGDGVVAANLPANGMRKQSRHYAFDFGFGPIRQTRCSKPPLHLDGLYFFQQQVAPTWENPVLCIHRVCVLRGHLLDGQLLATIVFPQCVHSCLTKIPAVGWIVDC